MTVTITGPVEDVTGIADNASWQFSSVLRFTEDGTLVTAKPKTVYPVAGILTVKLKPGPTIVTYGKQAWNVTVPDTDGTLKELIEEGIAFPPQTAQEALDAAVAQYVETNRNQFKTRAVPITSGPDVGKAQWVDANDDPVGDPVTWDQVIGEAVATAAATAAATTVTPGIVTPYVESLAPTVIADPDQPTTHQRFKLGDATGPAFEPGSAPWDQVTNKPDVLKADGWSENQIGIRKKESATHGTGYVFGTAASFGFSGTGTPAEIAGAFGIYQEFGKSNPGADVLKTTQGGYVVTTYWGPTVDDSAAGFSSSLLIKDAGAGFTQSRPITAFEGTAHIEGENISDDSTGGYVVGVAARLEVKGSSHVDKGYGFRAVMNTAEDADGTTTWYAAFGQPYSAEATTKFGVWVVDPIHSQSGLHVGPGTYNNGEVDIALAGDGRTEPSFAYLQSPSVTAGGPNLTTLRARAGAGQTKPIFAAMDSSGNARWQVSYVGSINHTRFGYNWANDSGVSQIQIEGGTSTGKITLASGVNFELNTVNGSKIGTGTTQKIGFWNATPVVQPTAVADATDAATVITQLNALLARMRTIGLIAT